ncbi:MAG: hypothetical protein VCB25_06390 [Myxococcota bacterium]
MPTHQDELEKIAALVLAPLVEVAWADGHVTPAEREAVFEAARALGLGHRSEFCRSTLRRWLNQPPPKQALEQWRQSLAPTLAASVSRPALKARNRLLNEAIKIAKMDGLDFEQGPSIDPRAGITDTEQRVLNELTAVLESVE